MTQGVDKIKARFGASINLTAACLDPISEIYGFYDPLRPSAIALEYLAQIVTEDVNYQLSTKNKNKGKGKGGNRKTLLHHEKLTSRLTIEKRVSNIAPNVSLGGSLIRGAAVAGFLIVIAVVAVKKFKKSPEAMAMLLSSSS